MTYMLILGALVLVFVVAVHVGFKAPRVVETGDPGDHGMDFRQVSVPIRRGKKLFGWYLKASDAPNASSVVVLHGWGANAEIMLPVAQPLYDAGMNVLLIDARNHGQSPWDGYSAMPKFAEDAGAAVDWLYANTGTTKVALLGHSVGAGAVLLVASRRDDIAAVISIASFAHPEWLMQRWLQKLRFPAPLIKLVLRYIEVLIGHTFDEISPIQTVQGVSGPVMLVHGDADNAVPVSDFEAIEANMASKDQSLLIKDAHHGSIDKIEEHGHEMVSFLRAAGL
ncbi:MAG: alpha/beta fold hydrolase [Rhodobacteraceae bacterium]|nr:alpha/beta fold hydrolase [Paracoccaceae bacterium]